MDPRTAEVVGMDHGSETGISAAQSIAGHMDHSSAIGIVEAVGDSFAPVGFEKVVFEVEGGTYWLQLLQLERQQQ